MNKNILPISTEDNSFRQLKQQLTTLLMFKSTTNDASSIFTMVYSFVMISVIERFFSFLPIIISFIKQFIGKKMNRVVENIPTLTATNPKMSSIVIHIKLSKPDSLGFALLDFITNSKNTRSIYFANNTFSLNDKNPILIDEENEIYSLLINTEVSGEKMDDVKQVVEIYSHKITIDFLRKFLNQMTHEYIINVQNKLGDKLFYFNNISIPPFTNPDGTKDYSKLPPYFSFTMKQFYTNRKFYNVIGEEIGLIKKRVDFFLKNEKWYNNKGIPYTLGLLLSGSPGTGKTSTIKCIANETGRHIINVQFNDDITKAQMENIFFNETIQVYTNDKKVEQYIIPIHKRIYVFEDVDCQNEIVLDREKKQQDFLVPDIQAYEAPTKQQFNILTQPNKATMDYSPMTMSSEKLTLSTLLNLLDGILETPGRIIIMTSNFPKQLDKALIRPGRIDLICEFTKCTNKMICEFFEKFYDIELTQEDKNTIYSLTEYIWSPADLTKIMFENFENYRNALSEIKKTADNSLLLLDGLKPFTTS